MPHYATELQFSYISVGKFHLCGILLSSKLAKCYSINGEISDERNIAPLGVQFEQVVVGDVFSCGIRSLDR